MRSNQLKIPGLALTCCLLIQLAGFAQKRNNVWMFGSKGGLNFNTTPVTPLNTNPNTIKFPNTISSISDTAGNLVFYTDGIAIWDRYHRKLDKRYTGWPWGDYVVPESFHPYNVPLLVPYIGNDSLYYLFGVSNGGPWPKNLQYLTLNSKMYAERGGIVYPEPSTPVNYFTSLLTNALPLLAGTHHCNRKDIWITTYKENAFYSFLVTAAGVSSTPVISSLPSAAGKPDTVRKYNIKFSANGEKIVFPMIDKNRILVMDFNNLTGEFNDPAIFNMEPGETLEDVELSPDGSKLYYGSYVIDPESGIELHNISQVDLEAGTPEQMRQSTAMLTAFPDRAGCTPRTCFYVYRTLQLGPDGKIYASMRSNFPFASVIEEPNEKGTQARYMFSGFNMKREYVHMSMNYIRSFSYSAKENGIQAKKANCADLPVDFSLLYERADSVKWDFGDAASGAANHSTALNAQHRFTTPGDYTVKAVIYHRCFVDTAVTKINIRTDEAVKLPTVLHDTTLCFGNNLIFDATAPYAKNYTWFVDNYLTYEPRRQVKTEGVYDVIIRNDCSIDRKVFNVKFTHCDCKVFVPGAFTPNNDGLNDVFKPSTQCFVQQYRFTVFNRFGQVVFTTTDPSKGWNGFSGPYAQGTGTFIWTVQYFDPSARKMMSDKGSVLLIK